jgi:hypothetical protein
MFAVLNTCMYCVLYYLRVLCYYAAVVYCVSVLLWITAYYTAMEYCVYGYHGF